MLYEVIKYWVVEEHPANGLQVQNGPYASHRAAEEECDSYNATGYYKKYFVATTKESFEE